MRNGYVVVIRWCIGWFHWRLWWMDHWLVKKYYRFCIFYCRYYIRIDYIVFKRWFINWWVYYCWLFRTPTPLLIFFSLLLIAWIIRFGRQLIRNFFRVPNFILKLFFHMLSIIFKYFLIEAFKVLNILLIIVLIINLYITFRDLKLISIIVL